jgi:membrane associated rhomboid family serine protease
MFPIRDHNPSGRTPYVTYALIAVNIVVFVSYYEVLGSPARAVAFFNDWGLVPAKLTEGSDVLSVFSSMFLHGGIMHLAGNMLYLWIFGDNLEDELGHGRFLGFYILSGVGAALAQVISNPDSGVPMVGASGAIAGVLGGYLLLFPKARIDILFIFVIIFKIVPVPAWVVLGIWFALQLFSGAATPDDAGGVAYWAHAGGFVAGMVLILPFWLSKGGPDFWRRTHGHPDHPEATYRVSRSTVPTVRRRK